MFKHQWIFIYTHSFKTFTSQLGFNFYSLSVQPAICSFSFVLLNYYWLTIILPLTSFQRIQDLNHCYVKLSLILISVFKLQYNLHDHFFQICVTGIGFHSPSSTNYKTKWYSNIPANMYFSLVILQFSI